MKVVIVGAGVIGASIAHRLAEAGTEVTVLERDYVGSGTSSVTFAWTNANRKPPRAYHDLSVAVVRAHSALAEEFGATPWFRVTGNVEWKSSDADIKAQRERVDRLQSWGYAAEWIDIRQLVELEPDIDPAAVGNAQIAFFPEEGLVDPAIHAPDVNLRPDGAGRLLMRADEIDAIASDDWPLRRAQMDAARSVPAPRLQDRVDGW